MQRSVFQCDVCGTEQQQANHWFAIATDSEKFTLIPLAMVGRIERAGLTILHLCGAACALRKTSEYLSSFSAVPKPRQEGEP